MRNRKIASTSKLISRLVVSFILYGLIYGFIIYGLRFLLLKIVPKSLTIVAMLITWFFDLIFILVVWRFSVKYAFGGKLININDIDKVMRVVFLVSVLLVVIMTAVTILKVNRDIDKNTTSISKISEDKANESVESTESTENKQDEEKEVINKEEIVNNIKHKKQTKILITAGGTLLVYLIVLPAVRRKITRYGM